MLCVGRVVLDLDGHSVQVGNRPPMALPAKEFELLRILMQHAGETVSYESVMSALWPTLRAHVSRTLPIHIRRLRDRLCDDQEPCGVIVNVRCVGYRYESGSE